jgi:hypothetical protein
LTDPGQEALRSVREHLDEAHAAADRLVREAQRQADAAAAGGPEQVPPRGWESARGEPGTSELRALLALLEAVRGAVPAELGQQLATALRDLLLALRALIDWYLERLGEPAPPSDRADVEDIPLD